MDGSEEHQAMRNSGLADDSVAYRLGGV